jgi:hypothetical protein
MMGLTTPDEDEYQRQLGEREQFQQQSAQQTMPVTGLQAQPVQPPQGAMDRMSPGTALQDRSDTMGVAMDELRRQGGGGMRQEPAKPKGFLDKWLNR